jgi:FMN reductase
LKIIGIGGTVASPSSTEYALSIALEGARERGAHTQMFGTQELLSLPHYGAAPLSEAGCGPALITAIRGADGVIIASPGYHGTISGLVKNALDYLEETSKDARPYLDDVPVGLVATAYGPQAAASTLAALRSVSHALRGWPTPYGACVISRPGLFTPSGCSDADIAAALRKVGHQTMDFAARARQARRLNRPAPEVTADAG